MKRWTCVQGYVFSFCWDLPNACVRYIYNFFVESKNKMLSFHVLYFSPFLGQSYCLNLFSRYFGSVSFYNLSAFSQILYTGVVVYAPALALNQGEFQGQDIHLCQLFL